MGSNTATVRWTFVTALTPYRLVLTYADSFTPAGRGVCG
jgi:hypothetical protein